MTSPSPVRTPLRPQFQTTECGVAVLRIMFAHLGFEPTTAEIRRVSGVSRDCVSAADIRRTARAFGFDCKALSIEPSVLRTLTPPLIVHLNFIHFVVLEGFVGDGVQLNCPAAGRIVIGRGQFEADFTGVALEISRTDRSPRSAREGLEKAAWWRWVAKASIPNLSASLRSRIVARLEALPLDVLGYRLPEVLYALVLSAHGVSARINGRLAPAAAGWLGGLAVLGWLAFTTPRTAAAFAAVLGLWLAWVWFWSVWRRGIGRQGAADDGLSEFVFATLGRPQLAKLADGPARKWRSMRGLSAEFQRVDGQVRTARTVLASSPTLLLIALLLVACVARAPIGPGLVAAATAIVWFSTPLTRLRGVVGALRREGFQWRDVLEEAILLTPVVPPPPPPGAAVVLHDVAFTFSSSRQAAFSGIDLRVGAGEQIGLVGPSGCGKSTLCKMIMGVYVPTHGTVSAVGRRGRVDRHATLFEGSVRDNLTLWDQSVSPQDLARAVADAGLTAVLADRAGGLDAPVEAFGANFSGGQRQRLEIARALARNPSLLILDDAIDALDLESELAIRAALRRRGCALILASHRAESIAACDRVFMMPDQRPPAAHGGRVGADLTLIAGDAVVRAEALVGTHEDALHTALDRLMPAEPGSPRRELSRLTFGEALRRVADERGHKVQRLRFTEPSWWRADFGKVLAFGADGVPTAVVAADLSGTERGAAAYREDAYAFVPQRAARLASITDWLRGAFDKGPVEAVRAISAAAMAAAGFVVIVAGLDSPLTPVRGAALAILIACELALLAFRGIAIQRFETAVRQYRVDGFATLLTRLRGDVLAHLTEVVVYRGLEGLEHFARRIVQGVGRTIPAAFAGLAGLVALDLRGGVRALVIAGLAAWVLLLIQLVGCLISKMTAGQEPNAGLASRRHLAVVIWGLIPLRLLGVASQAFERWVALDDRWLELRGRKRFVAVSVAGLQGLATLLAVAGLAGLGRTMADRALLAGIGWVVARSAVVIGQFMQDLFEDQQAAGDVRALLREAQGVGAVKVEPARATICVDTATVRYPGWRSPALEDVSLEIDPDALTVLAGASGSGKSTLLRVVLGLQRLERGVVRVGGHPIAAIDAADWRRAVAGVFQGDKLEDTATVRGHLCMAGEYALHEVWAALETVELAEEVRAMPMGLQSIVEAGSFSTGQQQRLLIAAALLQRPALMILDEATNAIPDAIQARIVARLRGQGVGCLVVTHRRTLIDLADRVHVLEAGRLVYSGSPEGVPAAATRGVREEAQA